MKKLLSIAAFLFLAFIIINGIVTEINKEKVPGKAKRIPCMSKTTSFERGYGDKDIANAQEQLRNGNFTLSSDIDKAAFMDSTLFEYIDMKELDRLTNETLNSYVKNKRIDNTNQIQIKYIVYENDKEDPKKKSDSCKLFRGYVVLKVKNINNKIVYQSQIDISDPKGKDIAQTVNCAVKAFITYNTK
ncbi:MAG: hypothetical protein U9Q33_09840 [Campylobacterota bacterium]|nr:hypothetical protein [Campylobacterota bacterium]